MIIDGANTFDFRGDIRRPAQPLGSSLRSKGLYPLARV
jgi:hypothetical protein